MDSFILFNDNTIPPTDDKPLPLEQETYDNEIMVANTHEIVSTAKATNKQQEENPETEITSLSGPQTTETLNTNLKQEVTWQSMKLLS